MRQWLVNPQFLCRKHLLGEHVELHMLIGSIKKERSIQGFIDLNLIDLKTIYSRHEELVDEMIYRGYNHKSPLEIIKLPDIQCYVDIEKNIQELKNRCEECKKRIEDYDN